LQIDPRTDYEKEFIKDRIDLVISQWSKEGDDQKQYKKLVRILNRYDREHKFIAKNAIRRSKKLKISEETINEIYVKKSLTSINHDAFVFKQLKGLGIFFAVAACLVLIGVGVWLIVR